MSRLKMIIPLGVILMVSYSLSIDTPSSNSTTKKFVKSNGEVLPENKTEYDSLPAAERKSWQDQGKVVRPNDIGVNWDHVEIIEKEEISKILEKKQLNQSEIFYAKEVIAENNKRETENMVGMGIWSFYILLGIAIIVIIITELLSSRLGQVFSSKLEVVISTVSRKSSK